MLTAAQIAHYEAFGFVVLKQLFTPDEAAIMKCEAEEIFAQARGGRPFTGTQTEYVQPFFERRPFLFSLLDDDRIYNIGVDLCKFSVSSWARFFVSPYCSYLVSFKRF